MEVFSIKSLNTYKKRIIFLANKINGMNHGSDSNACLRAILSLTGYLGSPEVVDEAW